MSVLDPIDRHYQIGADMMSLADEYNVFGIRALTSYFAGRIDAVFEVLEKNSKLLPQELPDDLQRFIHAELQPAFCRLRLLKSMINLFDCPGDHTDDGPDFGGDDDDPKKKPSPTSPLPMAV